nr:Arc family DNA-binding protein [Paracoccus sp. IB05]
MPEELKVWLTAKAQTEGRSMNRQIVEIIKAAMAAETQETAH